MNISCNTWQLIGGILYVIGVLTAGSGAIVVILRGKC